MNSDLPTVEIRRRFLEHFSSRGHTEVPSASLIAEDPTLLLVNAGMVPFKPYFTGELTAPWPRATSAQKCVRTVDIDLVGTTTRHGSFFQMCGNFSFGDYFKDAAIPLAWEFVTGPAGLALAEDRLWVTVYDDDDEAADIWARSVGVRPDRIQRRGRADNFWSMGVPGPCGPCSEIFWDRGPDTGRDGGPAADEDRYVEIWNLVFMQFERGPGAGKDFPILGDLPARNIDTGLGLDRVASILQGVDSLYDIDINRPVLDRAAELARVRYGADPATDVRLRVIGDHARTAVMLIADGVVPGNEGRGYVLRRMLRRAVRTLRLLGVEQPAMAELVPVVRDSLGPSFPELVTDFARIERTAVAEEEAFGATLRAGTTILDTAIAESRAGGVLSGTAAFRLHDTYGFPLDLTLEMAAEQGLSVDEQGFRRLMAEQRQRAQADTAAKKSGPAGSGGYREVLAAGGAVAFTGYTELTREARVLAMLAGGQPVPVATAGSEVEVVLDATPFYPEGGGQQADTGWLRADGAQLEVLDVQRPLPELVVHRCRVHSGELTVGAGVWAEVDPGRRAAISRSHTATHLVHRALRDALGEQASQAGSLNAPGRLRFDFANPGAVPGSVLTDVEDEVNAVLERDLGVRAFTTSAAEARRIGATALFGEKYGDQVRVVEVGDYSLELCGGTHVARSGQLGLVKLLAESSIGAGVRRVEALVGLDAFRFLAREHVLIGQLSTAMRSPAEELPERISQVLDRLKTAERELDRLRGAALLAGAGELARGAEDAAGALVVAHQVPAGTSAEDLRALAVAVRAALPVGTPGLVALAGVTGERAALVVAVNEAGRAAGLRAGQVVGAAAALLGGKGGGKDDLAQGGGGRVEGIEAALRLARSLVADRS